MPRREEVLAQMVASLRASDPEWDIAPGSPEWKILEAVAQEIELISYNSTLNDYHFDIDNKSGLELELFLALFGYARVQGRRATGAVTFGMENEAVQDYELPSGTQVKTNSNPPVLFQTTTKAVLSQGSKSVTVPVEAVVAGTAGNVPANSINKYLSPIGALTWVNNDAATSGGRNAESDESLRTRWRQTVFRNISGTEDRFLATAYNESSFVTRANVIGPVERFNEQVDLLPPYDRSVDIPWQTSIISGWKAATYPDNDPTLWPLDLGYAQAGSDRILVDNASVFPKPTSEAPLWIGVYGPPDTVGNPSSEENKLFLIVKVVYIDFDNNILYLEVPLTDSIGNNGTGGGTVTGANEQQLISIGQTAISNLNLSDELYSVRFDGTTSNTEGKFKINVDLSSKLSGLTATTAWIDYGPKGAIGSPARNGQAGYTAEVNLATRMENALNKLFNGTSINSNGKSTNFKVFFYRGDGHERFYIRFMGALGGRPWPNAITFEDEISHCTIDTNVPITTGGGPEYFTNTPGGILNSSYSVYYDDNNGVLPAGKKIKIVFKDNLGGNATELVNGTSTPKQLQNSIWEKDGGEGVPGTRNSVYVTGGGETGQGFPYVFTLADNLGGWRGLLWTDGTFTANGWPAAGPDETTDLGDAVVPFTIKVYNENETLNQTLTDNVKYNIVSSGLLDLNTIADYKLIFTDYNDDVDVTPADIEWDDTDLQDDFETLSNVVVNDRVIDTSVLTTDSYSPIINHTIEFTGGEPPGGMGTFDYDLIRLTQNTAVLQFGMHAIEANKVQHIALGSFGATGDKFKLKINNDTSRFFTYDNPGTNEVALTDAQVVIDEFARLGYDVLVQPLASDGAHLITNGFDITYVGPRFSAGARTNKTKGVITADSVTNCTVTITGSESASDKPFGPTGGTFKLSYNGVETAAIAYDAADTDVDTALTNALVPAESSSIEIIKLGEGYFIITVIPSVGNEELDIASLTISNNSLTGPALFNDIIYLQPLLQMAVEEKYKGWYDDGTGGGGTLTGSYTAGTYLRELWLTYSDDNQYVYEQGGEIVSYYTGNEFNTLVEGGDHTKDYVYYSGNTIPTIQILFDPDLTPEDQVPYLPAIFITHYGADKTGVDAVINFEYEYTPWSSRNDPANMLTNKIDIFVDGEDNQKVIENIPFPSEDDTAFFFEGNQGLGTYSRNYLREDGITIPYTDNYFVPLAKAPISLPPESITAMDSGNPREAQTYYLNQDYWYVEDMTDYYGSPRSKNGLEWVRITESAPVDIVSIEEKTTNKPKGSMKAGWYAYAYNIVEDGIPSELSSVSTVQLKNDKKKATNKASIAFTSQPTSALFFYRNLYRTKVCNSKAEAEAQAAANKLFFVQRIGTDDSCIIVDKLGDSHLQGSINGAATVQPPKLVPSTDSPLAIEYSYNKLIERLDAQNNIVRVIGQDVLTHKALIKWIKFNLAIVPITGFSLENIRNDVFNNIDAFLKTKRYTGDIQLADIIHVAETVAGVDNVRFSLQDETMNDVQEISIWQTMSDMAISSATTEELQIKNSYSLSLDGYVTGTFEYDANEISVIRDALEQLPNVEPGLNYALALTETLGNEDSDTEFNTTLGKFNAEAVAEMWFDGAENYSAPLYLQIEDEIMHVYYMEVTPGNPGNILFKVVRGALGSERASHTVSEELEVTSIPIDILGDIAVSWSNPWNEDTPPSDAGASTNPYVYQITFLVNGVTGINNWGTRFVEPIVVNKSNNVDASVVKIANGAGYGVEEYARNKRTITTVHTTDFYFRANELPLLYDVNVVFRGRNSF